MTIQNVGDKIMNTYLYSCGSQYIMIDTGYEHSFKSVLKKMKKYEIKPSQIKYVFLTHAHDDHAGFLNELLENFPHIKLLLKIRGINCWNKTPKRFILHMENRLFHAIWKNIRSTSKRLNYMN